METRGEIADRMASMAASEIRASEDARRQYLDLWHRSGVTVASATYGGPGSFVEAFEESVTRLAEARGIVDSLEGELVLVRNADDIERAHRTGKHGLILDFQDTIPIGTDLGRIDLFHHLGGQLPSRRSQDAQAADAGDLQLGHRTRCHRNSSAQGDGPQRRTGKTASQDRL